MRDLGLSCYRAETWKAELTAPLLPGCYANLDQELLSFSKTVKKTETCWPSLTNARGLPAFITNKVKPQEVVLSFRPTERVLIIGSGLSGIVAAHYFSQEDRFDVTVVERAPLIGGVWRLDNHYPTLTTNNSRDTFAFPDLPMDPNCNDFLSQEEVNTYLEAYVDKFSLRSMIHLNVAVKSLRRESSESAPFGFLFHAEFGGPAAADLATEYDYVVLATGQNSQPYIPKLPGQELFKGITCHTSQVRKLLAKGPKPKSRPGLQMLVHRQSYCELTHLGVWCLWCLHLFTAMLHISNVLSPLTAQANREFSAQHVVIQGVCAKCSYWQYLCTDQQGCPDYSSIETRTEFLLLAG